MSGEPREVHEAHTRLLRCALEVEESRAYWAHTDGSRKATAVEAFQSYWFGARSLPRIEVLLANMHARYDAFPAALRTLHRWRDLSPDSRQLICHWHLQLTDPLYRNFSGDYLVHRRASIRPQVTRDLVVEWVEQQEPGRWTVSTRVQFASKLLSAAYSAGIVTSNRDPRPLGFPRVEDRALEYLLYLLRGVTFNAELLTNPYLESVGVTDNVLEHRLRRLTALQFSRQGDIVDFAWSYADLDAWAEATLADPLAQAAGA